MRNIAARILVISLLAGNAAANGLLDDLRVHYDCDETSGNLLDSHTGGHDMTDNNTVGNHVSGKIGSGRDYVSTNSEYHSLADHADVSFGDEDFTIAVWVNLDATAEPIISKWDAAANDREYMLRYDSSNTEFDFWISSNGTATATVGATTFGAPSTGTYYFLVAYHDATANEIGISVNGGTVDTASYSSGCNDNISELWAGRLNAAYANGKMDEWAIWGRVLSAADISALYNSGSGLAYGSFTSSSGTILPILHAIKNQ